MDILTTQKSFLNKKYSFDYFRSMKLHTIDTGLFKLDGGAMHGVVPKSMWQKANPADESNMCSWAMRCLLIENGNRIILIDTGMGDKQSEKFFSYYFPHGNDSLLNSIKKTGFEKEDITDVILTHLHFDHCGGAVSMQNNILVPTFPNATYWSQSQHWQTAVNPNAREKASFLKENILPLMNHGVVKFTDLADTNVLENISFLTVNGHTDSMILPLIDFKGKKILYCADLIPSMAHISLPWVMAYDMRPLDTLNEKESILQQAVTENWVLFLEHDLHNECVTLQQNDRGIRHQDILKLYEI